MCLWQTRLVARTVRAAAAGGRGAPCEAGAAALLSAVLDSPALLAAGQARKDHDYCHFPMRKRCYQHCETKWSALVAGAGAAAFWLIVWAWLFGWTRRMLLLPVS